MTVPTHSPVWYRVAALRPALNPHASLTRHVYRGTAVYVVHDSASGRSHLFSKSTRLVLTLMNGTRSVAEILSLARAQLHDRAPTQAEMIALLRQLHAADLLRSNLPPDTEELLQRAGRHEAAKRLRSFANPMAIPLRLIDPDRLLDRMKAILVLIWSRLGAAVWLAIVLPAIALIPPHWPEITDDMADRLLSVSNLFVLYLLFPVLKAWHEFGHATAVKSRGGEVHDMGVILLGLLPVPYVDASASTMLRSKYDRALIAAGGMAAELLVAALSFYGWLVIEPGLLRAVLFNIMITAGVSTLIFNGNPLLRYDAYYILSDLAEVPNLASRAARCWQYLWYRYAVGLDDTIRPAAGSEMVWLLLYGVASGAYRVVVATTIAFFIAGKFFFIGFLIAIWSVAAMVLLPLFRGLRHSVFSSRLRTKRARTATVALSLIGATLFVLFVVPLPYATTAIGVVWPPDKSLVRAGTDGVITEFLVPPGRRVETGTPLVRARNQELQADVRIVAANTQALQVAYRRQYAAHAQDLQGTRAQIELATHQLNTLEELADELTVKARTNGRFLVPQAKDLIGRYIRKGDLIGYVVGDAPAQVRIVVTQSEVDELALATDRIEVHLADRPGQTIIGHVTRTLPNGESFLPSRAFAPDGGGPFTTDPTVTSGTKSLQRTFQFDVALDLAEPPRYFGQHAYVRFIHRPEPLAPRLFRALRLLVLSHLMS